MFEKSVMLSRFSAGTDIASVESRVKRLQTMIDALETQRQSAPPQDPAQLQGKVSFKSYLGNATPPPKITPLTGTLKERFETIQPLVQKYAAQYNIDINLVNAVIRQESGFNPNAVSHAGAQGLMQLMPSTAKSLGVKNPFDPEQNLAGGIRHLAGLLEQYQGNVALALAAYNAGSGAVAKYNGIPPYKETQNYVRKILAAYLNAKSQQSTVHM